MILHWGSPQPSLCSHPCCSSASPQSITHKCLQELVQSPAKSWVGTAGGFTSSPCGCTLVNDWEVRMTHLFIYLFRRKGTFPVGVVPGRGCHLELSLLWHWGSHAHWHSSTPTPARHEKPPKDTRKGLVCNNKMPNPWGWLLKGIWRRSTTTQWTPLNYQICAMLRRYWFWILPLAEFNIWTTFVP